MDKAAILKLLESNDKAVARALIVLFERQTTDEQNSDCTNQTNGRGFSHAHSFVGCRMAKFYLARGFLTQKQVAYWRASTSKRGMRIGMYWKQLAEAAAEKQIAKAREHMVNAMRNEG